MLTSNADLETKTKMYPRFRADAQEGLVVVRLIHYFRKPEERLYGISDEDIYKRGFLNFNYHPDQRTVGSVYLNFAGSVYSSVNAKGTKVNGLPVRLMDTWETAVQKIENGKLFPSSSMKSKKEDHNDGAILLTRFSLEQLLKMGFGINTPFDMSNNKPYAELTPEERDEGLYLKIKRGESLNEIDAGLRSRFDSEGYLLGSDGEFYIPQMLSIEEYRDRLLVFRPDDMGNGFHRRYWAKDIPCTPT